VEKELNNALPFKISMANKMEYLIRGIKGEKDKIVWSLGEREGFVYVYELKETVPFKEVVKSLPEIYTRDREDENSTKMQLFLWIKKKYGTEPQEI
jgi:hypothetical protein